MRGHGVTRSRYSERAALTLQHSHTPNPSKVRQGYMAWDYFLERTCEEAKLQGSQREEEVWVKEEKNRKRKEKLYVC